jgi:hypothetical protein
MNNKQVYIFESEKFLLKDYGDITWEDDEYIVNSLTGNMGNIDINRILSIVLIPENVKVNIQEFNFLKGKLKIIKKLLKEDIVKARNDFLSE